VAEWACEIPVLLLGAWCGLRRGWPRAPVGILLLCIPLWGFGQLAFGITPDRAATWSASLRMAALCAAAVAGHAILRDARTRTWFLRAFVAAAFVIGVLAVLASYTSPGQILWTFPSLYPDTWGPFLSRNTFAQFLELALPVALWFAIREHSLGYAVVAAALLAAGFASASRAGAVLLAAECLAVGMLLRQAKSVRRTLLYFAVAAVGCAALAGADAVLRRTGAADPVDYRREIARATLGIIAEHPWSGSGLGTFAAAYPAHATFDAGRTVEHAHDDWLEFAAEGGWPFAVLWMGLALLVAAPAIRSVWGIGVVSVCLHAVVDYPFARLGVALWIFILVGAVETTRAHKPLTYGPKEKIL
jgi:O-antigen ligase